MDKALNGHNSTQISQPPQLSLDTSAVIGSISTSPWIIGIAALAAAPEA